MRESGQIATLDEDATPIPPEKDKSLQDLKQRTPADPLSITTRTESAPVSVPLAQRITRVWQTMLLDAKHPKNPRLGLDGTTYYFSMWVQNHGAVSAEIWSSDPQSRTAKLVVLAGALSEYARNKLDAPALTKLLKPLE